MDCIYCGHRLTQVVNSRRRKQTNDVWRRRKCNVCNAVFTTEEHADLLGSLVLRRRGKIEAFNRDILFLSAYESCRHRPAAVRDATHVTRVILGELLSGSRRGIIERNDVIEVCRKVLGRLDPTAAALYDAYHQRSTTP